MKNLDLEKMINDDETVNNLAETNDLLSLVIVNELLNKKNIKTNSRIKMEQVSNLTRLLMFSETFKINFLKRMAHHIMELQVSIRGLGRKELVQMVQARDDIFKLEKQIKSKDIFR